ncbi:MAG: hypothetical protein IPL26_00985 [Leptospiraceae bacterium]|nr:hypothetical protein [Leptospiraceae bacterium]
MKYSTILLLLHCIFLFHCTLHNFKINGKAVTRIDNPKQIERKKFVLERELPETKISANFDNLLHSYNSDSLLHLFEKGCCIQIDKKSDYLLKYSTKIKEDMPFPIAPIFFLLTLGFFPVAEISEGTTEFQILNRSKNEVIKVYRYQTEHKYYTSWLSILASLFLWGDEWDLTMFHSHNFPQESITSKFENDFYLDLLSQRLNIQYNSKSETHNKKERYALLPVLFHHTKDKQIADVIRDKIETVLVNKKYIVLERVKLNEIFNEFKLAQNSLSRTDQIEIGKLLNANNLILTEILELNQSDKKLEFSVKNLEVESGQILWKYEFSVDESNTTESLNNAIHELNEKINE